MSLYMDGIFFGGYISDEEAEAFKDIDLGLWCSVYKYLNQQKLTPNELTVAKENWKNYYDTKKQENK